MSGRRRVQRSARVVVAVALLTVAGMAVLSSLLADGGVGVAAIGAVIAGGIASRIVYIEVTNTRSLAARERAEQARAFGAALIKVHREHRLFSDAMSARLVDRDRLVQLRDTTVTQLRGTLRLSERRIGELDECARRESRRANDAQERLAALLDEVLTQPPLHAVDAESSELPTVVDLLTWEERVTQAAEVSQQREGVTRLQA